MKEWSYTSTTPYLFIAWRLISNRDKFNFSTLGIDEVIAVFLN
jgi:hypothetical protein